MEYSEKALEPTQTAEKKLNNIRDLHHAIEQHIKENNLPEASKICNEVLALNNKNAQSFFLKAKVLFLEGSYKEAGHFLLEALALDSFIPDYYALLSAVYLQELKLEEANCIADQGLAFESTHQACLQMKALALIKLFRLQEAHSLIQKIQKLKQETLIDQEDQAISASEDPEELFEQALTINPFKTKTRIESLDTAKSQTNIYRSFSKLVMADRNHTFRGLAILIGLGIAISFFFREDATYKSFSLLILAVLLSVTTLKSAFSVITNIPAFLPVPFKKFLQKQDIRLAIKGLIAFFVMLAGFLFWHYTKSYVGLVAAVLTAGYFSVLIDDFSDGQKLRAFGIPKPKSANKSDIEKIQTRTIQLEEASYYALYQVLRKKYPGQNQIPRFALKFLKYGALFLILYPILFMILRASNVSIDYKFLVLPEIGVLFFAQFFFSLLYIDDIPFFYPPAARRFIPRGSSYAAYMMSITQVLLIASLILWLTIDNALILLASALFFVVVLRIIFTAKKKVSVVGLSKEELIDYIKHNHQTLANKS